MYGLEDLPLLFRVCYKNLWANIGSKLSEKSSRIDTVN